MLMAKSDSVGHKNNKKMPEIQNTESNYSAKNSPLIALFPHDNMHIRYFCALYL